jgi:hypothetical protein
MAEAGVPAWRHIRAALADKKICGTLYHGDFAPWNVRVVNSRNLQAFDWERGCHAGIPGWDWFHFVVQTAILARRHSAERAAAEVEQLFHADRFKNFAAAAGIGDCARPLLLAYLLHHQWVVKPLEGGKRTEELFDLLSARWQVMPPPSAGAPADAPEESASPGLLAGVAQQLKSAASQLRNLFWEPSLTAKSPTSLRAQFSSHRPVVLLAGLILAGVVAAQYFSRPHLTFLPFYLVPCSLLAWKIGRRWAMLAAIAAAVAGPLIANLKLPGYLKLDVMMWNMVMRFLTLQLCVLFVEQIHRHKNRLLPDAVPEHQPGKFTENWAVVVASGLLFAIVAALDYLTPPQMTFLPLYLMPCMVLTLVLNLRWGIAAALVAAVSTTLVQYFTDLNYKAPQVFGWNLLMHFAIYLFVVLLLDRIRRGNILFPPRNHHHRRPPAGRG